MFSFMGEWSYTVCLWTFMAEWPPQYMFVDLHEWIVLLNVCVFHKWMILTYATNTLSGPFTHEGPQTHWVDHSLMKGQRPLRRAIHSWRVTNTLSGPFTHEGQHVCVWPYMSEYSASVCLLPVMNEWLSPLCMFSFMGEWSYTVCLWRATNTLSGPFTHEGSEAIEEGHSLMKGHKHIEWTIHSWRTTYTMRMAINSWRATNRLRRTIHLWRATQT
jgi:hypothetical protein